MQDMAGKKKAAVTTERRMPTVSTNLLREEREAVAAWGQAQEVPVKFGTALRALVLAGLAAKGVSVTYKEGSVAS